jgi:hypothetical protein
MQRLSHYPAAPQSRSLCFTVSRYVVALPHWSTVPFPDYITTWFPSVSRLYCPTISQSYCLTPSLFTVPLLHSLTASQSLLSHYLAVKPASLILHCLDTLLAHFTTVPCPPSSLSLFLTTLLPLCPTATLSSDLNGPLPHFLTVPLYH